MKKSFIFNDRTFFHKTLLLPALVCITECRANLHSGIFFNSCRGPPPEKLSKFIIKRKRFRLFSEYKIQGPNWKTGFCCAAHCLYIMCLTKVLRLHFESSLSNLYQMVKKGIVPKDTTFLFMKRMIRELLFLNRVKYTTNIFQEKFYWPKSSYYASRKHLNAFKRKVVQISCRGRLRSINWETRLCSELKSTLLHLLIKQRKTYKKIRHRSEKSDGYFFSSFSNKSYRKRKMVVSKRKCRGNQFCF